MRFENEKSVEEWFLLLGRAASNDFLKNCTYQHMKIHSIEVEKMPH